MATPLFQHNCRFDIPFNSETHSLPPRKPLGDACVKFQRWERHAAKTAFAVDQNALVIAEIAEFVRLNFMFFGFVVIHISFAGAVTP